MLTTELVHKAPARVVWTYEPNGWPAGIFTGLEEQDGFRLEHVVVFPGQPYGALFRMMRAGAHEARRRGYAWVIFHLPHAFLKTPGLMRLAARLGCHRYAEDATNAYYVYYPRSA